MNTRVKRFLRSESGVTALEYALLGSLISVAIVVVVSALGDEVSRIYTYVKDHVVAALS